MKSMDQPPLVEHLRFLSNAIMLHESNKGKKNPINSDCVSPMNLSNSWDTLNETCKSHLCRISFQCSNAFLKVGAINRLITNTAENILIMGKSFSEIVSSTRAESG